jgi:cell division protein FtsW (lipid II flippase)
MTPRRVVLATLGALVIIGFVLMAHSDGRLDRLVAFLVIFIGFALVVFTTARPSQAALARYWRKDEKK